MALGIVGAPSALSSSSASSTSGTLTIPGTAAAGDVGVFVVVHGGTVGRTINATNSWGSPAAVAAAGTTLTVAVYVRKLTASDPGTTVGVTFSGSQVHSLALVVLTGADAVTGTPSTNSKTTASTSAPFSSTTPAAADAGLLWIVGARPSATSTAVTFTGPAGFTDDVQASATTGSIQRNGVGVGHQFLSGGAGVAQTPGTVTLSTSSTDVAVALAIAPAVSGLALAAAGTASSTVDGTATPVLQLAAGASGIVATDGTASAAALLAAAGTASSTVDGTATPVLRAAASAAGSITTGGAAGPAVVLAASAAGSITTGGSAAADITAGGALTASGSGAVTTGGSASAVVRLAAAGTGAGVVGGTATPRAVLAAAGSGATLTGGAAGPVLWLAAGSAGWVSTGGSAAARVRLAASATATVGTGGSAAGGIPAPFTVGALSTGRSTSASLVATSRRAGGPQ